MLPTLVAALYHFLFNTILLLLGISVPVLAILFLIGTYSSRKAATSAAGPRRPPALGHLPTPPPYNAPSPTALTPNNALPPRRLSFSATPRTPSRRVSFAGDASSASPVGGLAGGFGEDAEAFRYARPGEALNEAQSPSAAAAAVAVALASPLVDLFPTRRRRAAASPFTTPSPASGDDWRQRRQWRQNTLDASRDATAFAAADRAAATARAAVEATASHRAVGRDFPEPVGAQRVEYQDEFALGLGLRPRVRRDDAPDPEPLFGAIPITQPPVETPSGKRRVRFSLERDEVRFIPATESY